MSAIVLESGLVHYEALGHGKPLLFLHDWLGSWRYWVPIMVEMSSSYRAYALDFWGFGDSDKVGSRYTLPDYVVQVEMFMDQMGINQTPMVGHGLGGLVALSFAAEHPDRVEQIMTVSVPFSAEHIARTLSGFGGGDNPAKAILGRRLRAYEEVDIEAAKTDGTAVVDSVRSAMAHDLDDLLTELDMPVLLVNGEDDPIIQMPDDGLLALLDYNVYAYAFVSAQHYPMLEETSKFTRLLRDFLTYRDAWDKINVKDEWKRRIR